MARTVTLRLCDATRRIADGNLHEDRRITSADEKLAPAASWLLGIPRDAIAMPVLCGLIREQGTADGQSSPAQYSFLSNVPCEYDSE